MQFIEKETGGRVVLGAGTLYGVINALVKKNGLPPLGLKLTVRKRICYNRRRKTESGRGIKAYGRGSEAGVDNCQGG